MAGSRSEPVEVVCCFCGNPLPYQEATRLIVVPPGRDEGKQALYCHSDHLRKAVIRSIPLDIEIDGE